MRRYALQILLLVNAALALVLLWLWVLPDGSLRNVLWQPPEARKTDLANMLPALPGVGSADTSQFIAMLDRPLFSMTRRPPPPPPPPQAEAPVDNLSTARLTGVFHGAGAGGIIINIAGKDRRVRLNEAIDGWTVQAIQERNVTFARGGNTRTLTLPRAALATYTGLSMSPAAPAQPAQPDRAAPPVRPANAPAAASPSPKAVFGGSR